MSKNYEILNELVPKTRELHRAIFDKGYDQGKRDAFDKISAEIEKTELNITYKENYKVGGTWGLRKALEIIDKYRAESEE